MLGLIAVVPVSADDTTWAMRAMMTGMLGIILYFVRGVLSTIKANHADVMERLEDQAKDAGGMRVELAKHDVRLASLEAVARPFGRRAYDPAPPDAVG